MQTLPVILMQNGLPNLTASLVEAHRSHEGVWRIKFCYESQPPLSMSLVQALNLATDLQRIGEIEFASEVDEAVQRARHYDAM